MTPFHFSLHRWWQNMGFGIQSKTDFNFLNDIIRETHPYYIYNVLKTSYPQYSNKEHKRAQLLYRLCYNLRNEELYLTGHYSDLEKYAIHEALICTPTFHHIIPDIKQDCVYIVKDINKENKTYWEELIRQNTVTFDMVNIGIAFTYSNRYPEHYKILSK